MLAPSGREEQMKMKAKFLDHSQLRIRPSVLDSHDAISDWRDTRARGRPNEWGSFDAVADSRLTRFGVATDRREEVSPSVANARRECEW